MAAYVEKADEFADLLGLVLHDVNPQGMITSLYDLESPIAEGSALAAFRHTSLALVLRLVPSRRTPLLLARSSAVRDETSCTQG